VILVQELVIIYSVDLI